MSRGITIKATIRGEPKIVYVALENNVDVEWIEKKLRNGWSISGGFLSSLKDTVHVVTSLTLGATYYFLDFYEDLPRG